MSSIDINTPPPGHKFSVSIDKEETAAERGVRLFKEVALFVAGLVFVGLVAWFCFSALNSPGTSAEEKKWAMSFLSAAAGGIIGYLVKR